MARNTRRSEAPAAFANIQGEMAERIRRLDGRSALGDPGDWPPLLRATASVMLAAAQPMFIVWGPEMIWLYNDAFIPLMGRKHPGALGRHALAEVWSEAREALTPLFAAVYAGQPVQMEDISLELDRDGRPEEAHFSFSYTPIREASGAVVGLFGVCTETTEIVLGRRRQEAAEAALTASLAQTEAAVERLRLALRSGAIVGVFVGDLTTNRFVADEEFARFFGLDPAVCAAGIPLDTVMEAVHPADRSGVSETMAGPLEAGGPYRREFRARDSEGVFRWIEASGEVVLDEAGHAERFPGVLIDVEDRRRAEEHRNLLINELNHRVKNTLAVVQALARQTFHDATDVRQGARSFEDRLMALSRAHELLTAENWAPANLRTIVEGQLAMIDPAGRFDLEGPDVSLAAQPAVSLALVIHELATNATKHGALSKPGGRIEVAWSVDRTAGRADLVWTESGGPAVSPTRRRGFGSRMISRAMPDGRVDLDFRPGGVVCRIQAPCVG